MVRRTKADAEATRTQLLDAAAAVFFEKGISRTSLADIAQRAGVTRGAVYWHFKDKVDIFRSMMQRVCMPFEQVCDDLYGKEAPLARIRLSIQNVLHSLAQDEHRIQAFDIALFKMEYVGELAEMRAHHIDATQRACEKFRRDLSAAAKAHHITLSMPAVQAARGLHALFSGLVNGWVLSNGSFALVPTGTRAVDSYLAGLGFAEPLSAMVQARPA